MMRRRVTPEALDHLPAEDPKAERSRRDLVRVHYAMGTQTIVRRAWQSLISPQRAAAPLQVLELGAGDGTLLLGVGRALAPRWPWVKLTLIDRQNIVSASTQAGFAQLGWTVDVHVDDALQWAANPHGPVGYADGARWDLITTTLFLHHFEGRELDQLLAAVASSADRFFACEPRRSRLALAGSHLVGAIGANAVTRGDAVLSVHAGFRDQELSERWSQISRQWTCRESAAGLFSHCFSAQRVGVDPGQ